jgi:hypothetical protein
VCSADPRYEEEVSGCTASVAILSSKKIFVVCTVPTIYMEFITDHVRETRVILAAFLV